MEILNADVEKSIVTNIICSKEYDKLKPFESNRYGGFECQKEYTTQKEMDDFQRHVDKIKMAMRKFGEERGFPNGLFDAREPILVFNIDGVLRIGDGQHRLAAAKQLAIPFFVQIVESPFGITLEDGKKRMDAHDSNFAVEYFMRMNKEMQMRWSASNVISTSARNGNPLAQYICDACNKDDLFNATLINNRVLVDVEVKGKKNGTKTLSLKPEDYYNKMKPSDEQVENVKQDIDEFMRVAKMMAEAYLTHRPRLSENGYKKALQEFLRDKYFTKAIMYVIKNKDNKEKLPLFSGWENCVNVVKADVGAKKHINETLASNYLWDWHLRCVETF